MTGVADRSDTSLRRPAGSALEDKFKTASSLSEGLAGAECPVAIAAALTGDIPLGGAVIYLAPMQFAFGDFTLDLDRFELRCGAELIPIEQKNFELLRFLVEHKDRAVSKDELLSAVWPDVIVTDASLSTAIAQVRKALGDDGQSQKFIRTIRGRGFRFVAELHAPSPRPPGRTAFAHDDAFAPDPEKGARPAIAVLPFSLLGSEAEREAIAEAIPAELIATLSRLRWIKVIARGSSFQFDTANPELDRIRSVLGATYALSGSVEVRGETLAIVVELTDTRSHQVIWAESFTARLDDIFDVREQIARQVVNALELRVPLNESERLVYVTSENLDAWGHYHLGARHMQTYSSANNLIAEGHFKKALALDPHFARAEAALSYTEFQNHFQMFGSDTTLHRELALEHAERAIAQDELDPFCVLNFGRAKWLFGEVEEALGWAERALALNPNYAFGFYNSAIFHNILCNAETADQQVGDAMDLSPLDPHLQSMLGTRALASFLRDDLTAAVDCAEQSLRAPNPHLYVFMLAAVVFHRTGQHLKAQACLERIRQKGVPFSSSEFLFHYNLRDSERKAQLVGALEELGI